ncbi:MAG: diguanylate cyclase [Wenzhouxiangella sp.]|jgi:diguanylate cyclase (GGDEF)-like protein|nr:diguanylate cyclase [Wenzhouxiangella sp.]
MKQAAGPRHDAASREAERRRVRLRRLQLATLAWFVSILLTGAAWALGILEVGFVEMGLLVLIVLASLLFFHLALRRGWSRGFKDPSMTLAHILFAIFIGLWIIAKAGEGRTILLTLFIMAAFFGAFQLRQREFMLVALVAVAGYTAIVVHDILTQQIQTSTQVVVLELAGFATLMVWLAWFGSYMANLRRALSRRNRELQEATKRLRHLAEHDELTGLPNRRRLIAQLEDAASRSVKGGAAFCIAVLDLDHFKLINDRHGHQAGDQVLTQFACRAAAVLRGADQLVRVDDTVANIGRFGGEEFLAILPDTDLSGGGLAAERLRKEISEKPFTTSDGPVECTVSIGVAEHQPGEGVHRTIARADEALYAAKNGGRNRVKTA